MPVYAYAEAVRCLEQALKLQQVVAPENEDLRCDLLLALGRAQLPLGQPGNVVATAATEAFALAESADRLRASRAALLALEALHRQSTGKVFGHMFRLWAERAGRFAPHGSPERVHADVAMARVAQVTGRMRKP